MIYTLPDIEFPIINKKEICELHDQGMSQKQIVAVFMRGNKFFTLVGARNYVAKVIYENERNRVKK